MTLRPRTIGCSLAAIAMTVAVVRYLRPEREPARQASPAVAPTKIRKLTTEQRRKLASQIERGRAARAASGPSSADATSVLPLPVPKSAEEVVVLAGIAKHASTMLRETRPFFTECYDKNKTVVPPEQIIVNAKVSVIADPDIGALVDVVAVDDSEGRPLPAEFDACIRDTLQSLALPPLADKTLVVRFSLTFGDGVP